MGGGGGGVCVVRGGDGAVVWVFSAVKSASRHYVRIRSTRIRFWKRVRLCLGALGYEEGILMQMDVRVPRLVSVAPGMAMVISTSSRSRSRRYRSRRGVADGGAPGW